MSQTYKRRKKRRKKHGTGKLIFLFILIAALVVLLVIYLMIASYYGKHYFPETEIAGFDCSKKTPEYVKEKLLDEAGSYLLTIRDRTDSKNNLLGVDISYHYTSTGEEEDILEHQEAFLWPKYLKNEKDKE